MAGKSDDKKKAVCSFCGRPEDKFRKLFVGHNAFICNECVGICSEIIEEEAHDKASADFAEINLLKPKEIKKFLDEYVIGQDEAKRCSLLRYIIIISELQQHLNPMSKFKRVIF